MKIAFVHNAYIEYRIPLFERLSTLYDVIFFFEWFDLSIGRKKPLISFRFLKSFKITGEYSFSPMLFLQLIKGKYQVFIAGAIGQANTYLAFFVSRLLRKPFIFWDENWYWPCTKWRRIAWPFLLLILKYAEAVVVPGSKSRNFYIATGIAKEKIFVAPNASLLPLTQEVKLRAAKLKKSLSLEDKKVILFCGRLIRVKGFKYLLKAFSKLQAYDSNTVLLVIGGVYGTGNRYGFQELESIYQVFGRDKVYFAGTVINPEKAAYFLLADVIVVPSIFLREEYEVWGFAVNESMSVGKPVVATVAVGAAYDLIQDGKNGFMVPDRNSEALFEAIKTILDPSFGKKNIGIQSSRIIQEGFTHENMLMGFKQAIDFASSSPKKSNSQPRKKFCNDS